MHKNIQVLGSLLLILPISCSEEPEEFSNDPCERVICTEGNTVGETEENSSVTCDIELSLTPDELIFDESNGGDDQTFLIHQERDEQSPMRIFDVEIEQEAEDFLLNCNAEFPTTLNPCEEIICTVKLATDVIRPQKAEIKVITNATNLDVIRGIVALEVSN